MSSVPVLLNEYIVFSRDAGIVARMGVAKGIGLEAREGVWVGGSAGVSFGAGGVSLWCPVGVSGRRKVPLLGAGVRLSVSQMML